MLISGYTSPWDLLREELNQRKEEGFLIPAELTAEFDGLDPEKDAWNEAAIAGLYAKLEACRRDPAFPFEEPNGLDEIRACRPERRKLPALRLSDDELLDKFHGAWLGRSVGCALGKPVECMGMGGERWKDIRALLKSTGDWPLRDYFRFSDKVGCRQSCRGFIEYMESDDDIRYTLMGLLIIEKHGRDFTWRDVAWLWENQFPMAQLCTAECQAALNYNLCGARMGHRPYPLLQQPVPRMDRRTDPRRFLRLGLRRESGARRGVRLARRVVDPCEKRHLRRNVHGRGRGGGVRRKRSGPSG